MINKILAMLGWFASERVKDYRESASRIYELSVKTTLQINQIILTVSVASLAAVAAFNQAVFDPYGPLAFMVVVLFALTLLLSAINLYLSTFTLADIRQKLSENFISFKGLSRGIEDFRFKKVHKTLSVVVFLSFCLGIIAFLLLFGVYIFGDAK